jgi:hypothetical protein
MAHFVQINDNVCGEVIVVNNEVLENKPFPESESIGIAFCKSIYGEDTEWLQTSYNKNFRKNYAGTGYLYDKGRDAFITPEPKGNIGFDEKTCQWIIPVV